MKKTPARTKTNIPIARYTHCTRFKALTLSAVSVKKTYEASAGATTVPIPLKAWAKLIRISAYFGGPQTACDFSILQVQKKQHMRHYLRDTGWLPSQAIPTLNR